MKDPHLMLTESILGELREMRGDLKDIKEDVTGIKESVGIEIHSLKLKQQSCDSYWGMVAKALSFAPVGAVVGYIASIFIKGPDAGP